MKFLKVNSINFTKEMMIIDGIQRWGKASDSREQWSSFKVESENL